MPEITLPDSLMSKLSPEDQKRIKDSLAEAVGAVTQQGPQELAKFVSAYAVDALRYAPAALAGDAVAKRALKHIQVQAITDASKYGVTLLQKNEQLLMTALQVSLNTALKFVTTAAVAAIGA